MSSAQGEDYAVFIQIMGACIAIVPLALTPIVMKTAGGILNRFGGFVNNPNKGPVDKLRKAGEGYRNSRVNMRNARALGGEKQLGRGAFVRWRNRRGIIASGAESELSRAKAEYSSSELQSNEGLLRAAAGGKAATDESKMRVMAGAISAADKLKADEVSATNIVVKDAELSQAEIRTIALGGSVTKGGRTFDGAKSLATQKSALQQMVTSNDVEGMNAAWNSNVVRNSSELRSTFADALQSASGRPSYFSQGAIAGLRQEPKGDALNQAPLNIDQTIENAIKAGAYSAEKIAGADKDDLAQIVRVMNASKTLSDDAKQSVMINAEAALTDDRLKNVVGKNKEQIQNIVNHNPTP